MNLSAGVGVQLLGRPRLEVDGTRATGSAAARAGRCWPSCCWPSGRRPASRLASLLFAEADDPLRALRWCLAEIRRGLGPARVLDGDPVGSTLPAGRVGRRRRPGPRALARGRRAARASGLDLLDGLAVAHADAVRGLAALPAPPAVGGGGVHRPRGRAGAARRAASSTGRASSPSGRP